MPTSDSIHILTDRVRRVACHQCGERIDVADIEPFTTVECPACHTQTPIPARLGSFLLFKELGKGAMGAVYQAFDQTLKRHVAVKVMHRSLGKDTEFVEQFLREARALAALNQPNVVQVYTCGQEKGQPYIVMELVPGGRVDHLMAQEEPLDEKFVLKTAAEVALGLKAAYDIGMTHGDIKPENILLARDGTAKVVDFGLASFAGGKPKPGEVWGTPFYIAPEKVRGKEGNHQSDIYSLGASLFHVLTKRPPFDGETAQDVVMARLDHAAPDVQTLREDLHPETSALIGRMLEQSVSRRYPNYDSLLADIAVAQKAVEAGPARSTAQPERKRSRVLPILVGILFVAAAGGAIWFASRSGKKETLPAQREKRAPQKMVGGKRVPAVESSTPKPETVDKPPVAEATAPPEKKAVKKTTIRKPMMTFPLTVQEADFVLETGDGKGADAYVQGSSASKNNADTHFANKPVLWVKSTDRESLHLARKVYLRFDLAPVTGTKVSDATLVLTAGKSGKNAASNHYALKLWGIKGTAFGLDWADTLADGKLTWNNAPANRIDSGDQMNDDAVLLAKISVPANPGKGKTIKFSNGDSVAENSLVDFINSLGQDTVTFAVTADSKEEHRAGWKFASKEDGKVSPPKLLLKK